MSNPYSANPQPGQYSGNPAVLGEIKPQATTSLIVGIVSIFCCGIILAPFAIYRGNKAKRLIQENNVGHEHQGMAQAGFIIGIISLVLNIIGLLFWLLSVIIAVANNGGRNF